MTVKRGDIVLARFPHASGGRGKKRPVLVIQSDTYNAQLRHAIVAEITTNLSTASDTANLLIDVSTPEGRATGLTQNSVVTCLHLATMSHDRLDRFNWLAECCSSAANQRLPQGRSCRQLGKVCFRRRKC